jgi:hypothetical protein
LVVTDRQSGSAFPELVAAAAKRWAERFERPAPDEAELVAQEAPPPVPEPLAPERTLPRPVIAPGAPISEYSRPQLVKIVRWILSDGLLRTDEELLRETSQAMGYKRIGSKIRDTLTSAVRQARM